MSRTARTILGLVLGCALALSVSVPVHGGGFQSDDATTTPLDHFEIDIANLYSHLKGETSGAVTSLEVDYGATKDLELHFYAPLAFDRKSGATGTRYGYGDTELGFKYRFVDQGSDGWRPAIATFPLIELPTGSKQRGLGAGYAQAFLPIWLEWDFGSWTVFGGPDYAVNPGTGNKNYWEVSLAVGYKVSDRLWLGSEIFQQTAVGYGKKPSTGFNIGGTYDFTEHHHLVLTVGRGLQNATETNQFTSYLAYELTF